MNRLARRKFLQLTAFSATELLTVSGALAQSSQAMKNIGVQLYTVREVLPKNRRKRFKH